VLHAAKSGEGGHGGNSENSLDIQWGYRMMRLSRIASTVANGSER